jgi:hypothetical protein
MRIVVGWLGGLLTECPMIDEAGDAETEGGEVTTLKIGDRVRVTTERPVHG